MISRYESVNKYVVRQVWFDSTHTLSETLNASIDINS